MIEILRRTRGRAFVLFTSYATLRAVQAMAEMALEYPILVQGTRAPVAAAQAVPRHAARVLFATSSFWQGVDVVGEALSCVIVDKLPFASPGDPITAARIDAIRAQGGEPFDEYQVPLAILALAARAGPAHPSPRDRGCSPCWTPAANQRLRPAVHRVPAASARRPRPGRRRGVLFELNRCPSRYGS